ncbi:hypothetical protein F0A17_18475 [Billgrantia pellis]|uniref:Lipoprotein with Yx(FWY)xxD motif n=1 Tax=Billgrantia pellis TaxID=2606936 RepID=A0A7V7KFK0_9GAMM|nr:hypothetical protein [Halomonas pellis]KAA0010445.1 hypothetical protein F0A17_18475 [Halomonas pellis]
MSSTRLLRLASAMVVLAGSSLAMAAPDTAETDGDDPMQVEGMSPAENEDQLDATSDPVDRAKVTVSEKAPYGRYLTNQDGKSLYLFDRDEQGGDYSTCKESCAIAWPPYTTEAPPVAGDGVDDDRLGAIERDDGTRQVTYDGWPLYFFARDVYPGDALGQDVEHMGGHWYLLSPNGDLIETEAREAAEPAEPGE